MRTAKGRAQAKRGPDRGTWRRWALLAVPPLLLAAVVFAAGFLTRGSEPKAGGAEAIGGPSPLVSASGAPAPDFTVTTTSGSQFRLSDQSGKVVAVLFTAPG